MCPFNLILLKHFSAPSITFSCPSPMDFSLVLMQFDRFPQFEKRIHWCCRLRVSRLRVDWQFSSVSTGLIRTTLLGVCVCVHVHVCICIQSKATYSCISMNCMQGGYWQWVSCTQKYTFVLACTHRWIFALRATYHCFSGLQYMQRM